MKKFLYYLTPFIVIPFVTLIVDFLDEVGLINMTPLPFVIILALIGIVIGNLSSSSKKFDYIIALLVPIAFFALMFVLGLFETNCDNEPLFSVRIAFETAIQSWAIVNYIVMAVATFFASYKSLRISEILKNNQQDV